MSTVDSTTSPEVRYLPVVGFPGYRVGDDGSVWSCLARGGRTRHLVDTWRRLKPTPQDSRRLVVILAWEGKRYTRFVHRLVLEAFGGPCPPGQECRHLNGDGMDNRPSNLAWGTHKENHEDAVRHGTAHIGKSFKGEACPSSKLTEDDVRRIMVVRRETSFGGMRICPLVGLPKAMFGAVDKVIHGMTWNHVTGLAHPRSQNDEPADADEEAA